MGNKAAELLPQFVPFKVELQRKKPRNFSGDDCTNASKRHAYDGEIKETSRGPVSLSRLFLVSFSEKVGSPKRVGFPFLPVNRTEI